MNLLWTAFVMGLAGSMHCAAMCGPLVMRFTAGNNLASRLIYQGGRLLAYVLIGLFFGLAGKSIGLFIYQQELSILTGIILVIIVLYPFFRKLLPFKPAASAYGKVYSKALPVLKKQPPWLSRIGLGFVNGLLPCGLVYMAATASIYKGQASFSLLYMLLFGLGTLPVMLGISWLNGFKLFRFRSLRTAVTLCIAFLFILRGMALDIPYLSPKVSASTGEVHCCCHKK